MTKIAASSVQEEVGRTKRLPYKIPTNLWFKMQNVVRHNLTPVGRPAQVAVAKELMDL